jgi:ketosteroid isomerase-like protein
MRRVRSSRIDVVPLLACTLLLGCAQRDELPRRPTAAEDEAAIRGVLADWVRVAEEGDAEAYGSHVTDDFIFLGPDAPPVVGKAAVVPWVAGFFADFEFIFPEWTTDEILISGDVAVHRYSGVATLTPKAGGEPSILDRKYLDILIRGGDGQWRVSRHMFNLN